MNAFVKIALPLAATLVCCTASAGLHSTFHLTLDRTNRYAAGSMGDVRADTAISGGYIGCTLMAGALNPGDLFVECQAGDGNGSPIQCATDVTSAITTSPLVKVVQSLTSNSYIYFGWDANLRCTTIETATGSTLQPIVF